MTKRTIEILYSSLIQNLKDYINKFFDMQSGFLNINKKFYSEKKYHKFIQQDQQSGLEYLETLKIFINRGLPLVNSNDSEDLKKLKSYCNLMTKVTQNYLNNAQKTFSITPPKKYNKLHSIWLDVYSSIFNSWNLFIQQYENLIVNPPPEKTYKFKFNLSSLNESLDRMIDEWVMVRSL